MTTVTGTMVAPGGGRPINARVVITLVDLQGDPVEGFAGSSQIVGQTSPSVDDVGAWTATLTPTASITSTRGDTLYRVEELTSFGQPGRYYISVPASGSHWVGSILADVQPVTTVAAFVHKAGDTMTGPLILSGDPTTDLQAATKAYADSLGGGGGGTPSGTVVAETGYGQSSAAGSSGTYSRGDHTHGTPSLSSSAAGASAVGDTAAAGVATTPARADHRHSREAFGAVTAQTTYGASSGNGSAATVARSDHTHGTPSLTSSAASSSAPGDAAAAGSATTSARADHVHGRESVGTTAGTVAAGDDARITGALQAASNLSDVGSAATARTNLSVPPTSRLVSAGTGLTGGGSLAADRTLTVAYGTSSGTATEGNDSRVTGAVQKSTLTAKGSLYVATASGTVTELAVGSDGQVLTADAAQTPGVKWATPAGGSSGMDHVYPIAGYGLLAASGVPEAFSQSSGIGDGQLYAIRTWIPAGVTITNLWVAVQTGGTYTTGTGNRLGLYDDTGAQVKLTAEDTTLWAASGWRGGALAGGAVTSQGSGRFVYILIIQTGFSGIAIPYAVAGSGAPWFSAGVGVTKRRVLYNFASLPASFDPTSYGTASSFLPLVGVS